MFACGKLNAVVVDIGYDLTTILPIYDGRPLYPYLKTSQIASLSLNDHLNSLIRELCSLKTTAGISIPIPKDYSLPPAVVDDIKASLLYVPVADSTAVQNDIVPDVQLQLPEFLKLSVPHSLRSTAALHLFSPDCDNITLIQQIFNCILSCPSDIRLELLSNILIIGSASMIPGIKSRFDSELKKYINSLNYSKSGLESYQKLKRGLTRIKIFDPIFPANCCAWVGASILASLKFKDDEFGMVVSREAFLKDGDVPDWTNIDL
ncbi:Actin- protein 10 [Nowakowskiella sp. JEL0407]|nr:Actin- protein 10 [Nowakowskiella sp. JEL0407]